MDEVQFDTLCFGGEDWWYHNRAHIDMQLMRRFAGRGNVIYVNSLVVAKPSLKEKSTLLRKIGRKGASIFRGLRRSEESFWIFSPFSLPVHHVSWLNRANRGIVRIQLGRACRKVGLVSPLIWVACPVACDLALAMKRSRIVYQRTDRFEEFPNVPRETVTAYDRTLKKAADLTVFVSRTLYEQERGACREAMFLDHGVDYDLFASAASVGRRPAEIAEIPKPIVGFFGGFAEHTTDLSLLREVISLLPGMSFVLIGRTTPQSEILNTYPNVWMLGQKAYQEIPHYGACFDVAIMPWQQNEWIKACNPIKLKEYLALGKPVVSRPYDELQQYRDVVYEAVSPEEFAQAIRRALAEDNPERRAVRRDKVRHASWDSKAHQVVEKLYGKA